MNASRVVSCAASGVGEVQTEWVVLDPGENPSRGARLAVLGGSNGVTVLLVELERDGLIAEHQTAEAAICYVIQGTGSVFLGDGQELAFSQGETFEFSSQVPHGWRGGSERTLLAVTVFSDGKAS